MEKISDTSPGRPVSPHQDSDQDFEEIRQNMAASMSQDETDRKARIEYMRSLTASRPPKKGHVWRKALVVLTVILVIAAGVYWFMFKDKTTDQPARTNSSAQEDNDNEPPRQVATKHYDSTTFNLGFDYPENWKVSETAGKIAVVSPAAPLKASSGTVKAQVVFNIQAKQSVLPVFKSGNGIATRTSEKVAYLKPTPNQRAQTYTTFVSKAGAATAGIDSIFVTGDLGYQKDQAVPQADIIQGDPLVSIFFATCEGTVCATDPTTSKIAIADSAWSDGNVLVKAAKAMLTSLTIQ